MELKKKSVFDIEVRLKNDRRRFPIYNQRAVVGRATGCDVRLGHVAELGDEHIMFSPHEGQCWASVAQGASPFMVDNEPFQKGKVPWGTPFTLGDLRLTPLLAEVARKKTKVSPLAVILGVLTAAMVAWALLGSPDPVASISSSDETAPQLFAKKASCRVSGDAAARLAEQRLEDALAKAERYVFDPHDGVEAGELLSQAAACFERSGEQRRTSSTKRRLAAWKKRLERDYVSSRTRLELALREERYIDAKQEISTLRALLRGRKHPYVEWLKSVERKLDLAPEGS